MTRLIHTLLAAALLTPGHRTIAQSGPGVISGSVIDASTELPLAGCTVILRLADEGALVSTGDRAPTILAVARQTITTDAGRYSFTGLAPARYELRAQRMGYLPATIVIELRGDAGSLVSMGLSVAAVRLQPVPVNADASLAFDVSPNDGASNRGDARIRAARARQREYTGTDVREITDADVLESGSLGETDILRALQRLPGVDTYGDYTAELWTRGGRWDQTRVYFDGVPLFAPTHTTYFDGDATISGFGTDVVGAALFLPGVRPPSIGEGAAGVVDLRSRPAVPDGKLRTFAELTMLSGRVALSRGARDGASGWSLAGRHTFDDLLRMAKGQGLFTPATGRQYFDDLTGRWDGVLPDRTRLQVSGTFSRDANVFRTGPHGPLAALDVARNLGLAATVTRDLGSVRLTHRFGLSDFDRFGASREAAFLFPDTVKGDTAGTRILHLSFAAQLEPLARGPSSTWRAGYELTHQQLRNRGFARQLSYTTLTEWRLERQATLPVGAVWGEYRWRPRDWLRIDAGLRVEGSRPFEGASAVRSLPRVQIRANIDSGTSISAGVGCSYLYTQTTTGGASYSWIANGSTWRLADRETPAVRSDVVTAGVERWASDALLLSATAYVRRDMGLLFHDPRKRDFAPDSATYPGVTRARGVEFSARRLAGRLTGSAAYTVAWAHSTALGMEFPADEERPRSMDITAAFQATSRLQLGASYTQMSGRRFTPTETYTLYDSTSGFVYGGRFGAHNDLRASAYESLDLLVDWSGRAWGARTGMLVQLRNVLGRWRTQLGERERDYLTTRCVAPAPFAQCTRFIRPLEQRIMPFMPLVGIRVAF